MIDLLLINPPSPDKKSIIIRDLNRSGRTSKERIIWPQTNLAVLAAMVPPNFKVEILDCIAEKIYWPEFIRLLNEKKPRYLISHVITSTASNDFKVFTKAKKLGTYTITMGPHVTELAEESLETNPALDFILMGECELTLRELITALEEKKTDFSSILGLAWRDRKQIKINDSRPFIANLDDLPLPRHDLLPIDKYNFPFIASKFTFVVASRGCPYPCTFCRQPIMWNRFVRHRSAENIMKELCLIKNLGIKNFIFHSDDFTIHKEMVKELCRQIIEQKINLSWACNSRVDTVDEEMLNLMKEAGCWMIAYGFESGSQKILDLCEKKAAVEQGEQIAKLTHKIGIKIYGYFIIGLIGETKKTIQETIDFARNWPIDFAIFHVASPYPGTKFYQQTKENGWLINEKWEDIDQGGEPAVSYPDLSNKEIKRRIKKAYLSFYLRPRAIWNILVSVKNFSELKNLIKAGFNQLF